MAFIIYISLSMYIHMVNLAADGTRVQLENQCSQPSCPTEIPGHPCPSFNKTDEMSAVIHRHRAVTVYLQTKPNVAR